SWPAPSPPLYSPPTRRSSDLEVDIYTHFLGSLTPDLGDEPLATVTTTGGRSAEIPLELPPVFGQTFLSVEHTRAAAPTFAAGTSPTPRSRDPALAHRYSPPAELGH